MTQISEQHNPGVTLLITHYNRSESLKRLLYALREHDISFEDIVVSDDGSKEEHFNAVKSLQEEINFRLVGTRANRGLGSTMNAGQDAVRTPFILYTQDDFVPTRALGRAIAEGLEIMKQEPEWDIVRFYAFPWAPYPYLKPYKKGFSEMMFSLAPWYFSHLKFYVYSDHPHLKRSSFPEKFGRYFEAPGVDRTEMAMCRSFLKNKGRGLFYNNFKDLFEHSNTEDEPGIFRPDKVKTKKFSDIKILHRIYLKYKVLKETISYILSK